MKIEFSGGEMKDSHMLFVLLAILVTPFLPFILKGKCPSCAKRKLESLEQPPAGFQSAEPNPFLSYYRCKNCRTQFVRERSGPLTPLTDQALAG
jgi:transposase-like protein